MPMRSPACASDPAGRLPSGAVDHLAEAAGDGGRGGSLPATCSGNSPGGRLQPVLRPRSAASGLVDLVVNGLARAAALRPLERSITVDAATDSTATFAEFFKVGVDHLLTGIDHLLFITMLLVPAMFRRAPGPLFSRSRWVPVDQFGRAFIETVKVLSAFTVAHALTLTSATIGYIHLPSQLIEASIALTILATAIDNVWHLLPERRWVFAFCFGLIHGFGFANALGPLALPPMALAIALLAFNLGLETVQIAVAALVLPFGFVARQRGWYRQFLLPAASAAVGLVALAWFTDRASGLGFMPF